jgi:hypothetical protein
MSNGKIRAWGETLKMTFPTWRENSDSSKLPTAITLILSSTNKSFQSTEITTINRYKFRRNDDAY